MSVTAQIQKATKVGGLTATISRTVQADAQIVQNKSVPAAKAGTLTTRTDNDTGIVTLGAGHGVVTGARVDLYWAGGCRRGVTVGTVAGVAVPVDGGLGDNLPAATTVIKVAVCVELTVVLDGDKLKLFNLYTASERAQFVFAESNDTEILAFKLGTGGGGVFGFGYDWDDLNGVVNPLAGEAVAKVFVSHDSSTAARTCSVSALLNN